MTAKNAASIVNDLHALNNSNLPHSLGSTAGASYYSARFRSVLQKYLPPTFKIARGYISGKQRISSYAEVLIYQANSPLLFEEVDLVIVEATAVVAILDFSAEMENATQFAAKSLQLSKQANLINQQVMVPTSGTLPTKTVTLSPEPKRCFAGIYAWKSALSDADKIMQELGTSQQSKQDMGITHAVLGKQFLYSYSQNGNSPSPTLSFMDFSQTHTDAKYLAKYFFEELFHFLESQRFSTPLQEANGFDRGAFNRRKSYSPKSFWDTYHALRKQEPSASPVIDTPTPKAPRHNSRTQQQSEEIQALNRQDEKGYTQLHRYAAEGKLTEAKRLLEAGVMVNIKNMEGNTPLHLAAEKGELKLAEILIQFYADVNAQNYIEDTPMHLAAQHDHAEIIALLAQHKANIENKNHQQSTPLHVASFYGSHKSADRLIALKANIEAKDENQQTPLHLVAREGFSQLVQFYIDNHADIDAIDKEGDSPLHLAAAQGEVKIIKVLINNHADVRLRNKSGNTYLQSVAPRKNDKMPWE